MHDWDNLSHMRWDYKYNVVIVPKYRKRALYGKLKQDTGEILSLIQPLNINNEPVTSKIQQ